MTENEKRYREALVMIRDVLDSPADDARMLMEIEAISGQALEQADASGESEG